MLLREVSDVNPQRLLLIEDDQTIAELLSYNLRRVGYEVMRESDGHSGLRTALSAEVDLVLVDLMLPGLDGMTVSREISRTRPNLPLIVITARTERDTMLEGFESGVDDYVTKPFDLDELLARIGARLRRVALAPEHADAPVSIEGLTLDADAHVLKGPLGEVFLKPREYDLLELLISRPEHLFRREEIMRRVWHQEYSSASRTLDVHVRHLRAKLQESGVSAAIQNVRGVGYRIVPMKT